MFASVVSSAKAGIFCCSKSKQRATLFRASRPNRRARCQLAPFQANGQRALQSCPPALIGKTEVTIVLRQAETFEPADESSTSHAQSTGGLGLVAASSSESADQAIALAPFTLRSLILDHRPQGRRRGRWQRSPGSRCLFSSPIGT